MANRFFTDDQTVWFGPTHIGPGDNRAKRIGKFVWDGPAGSSVAKLRAAYGNALEGVTELRDARSKAQAKGTLTPLGLAQHLGKEASEGAIPKVRRAKAAVESIKAEIAERRANFRVAKPSDEARRDHEEIRAALRGMSLQDRANFIKDNRQDPTVSAAIALAIPGLSGVSAEQHGHILAEQIEREHSAAIAEMNDLDEVVRVVERVADLAREELRETIGVDRSMFEKIAEAAERNGGRLPFKIDREVVDGVATEVARVLDINTRTWRRASAEEIMASRSDSAAA